MNTRVCLLVAAILLSSFAAHAQTVTYDDDGFVTGIVGLSVNGTIYTVGFEGGSYDSVFVEDSPTFLGDETAARSAALAILTLFNNEPTVPRINLRFSSEVLWLPFQTVDGDFRATQIGHVFFFTPWFGPVTFQGDRSTDYSQSNNWYFARLTATYTPPSAAIEAMIAIVNDLESGGSLNGGQATSLRATLNAALAKVASDQVRPATNILGAFTHQVLALVTNGSLTMAQGQELVSDAHSVIDDLLDGGSVGGVYTDATGRVWSDPTDVVASWNTLAAVCPTDGVSPCSGTVGGVDVTGWIWATRNQTRDLIAEVTGLDSGQLDDYTHYGTPRTFAAPAIALISPSTPIMDELCSNVNGWTSTSSTNTEAWPFAIYHDCGSDIVESIVGIRKIGVSSAYLFRP